ncbi:M23 family metallopeptidase [bacterium]|nr:M23 family metallopeptidase [bacterium]
MKKKIELIPLLVFLFIFTLFILVYPRKHLENIDESIEIGNNVTKLELTLKSGDAVYNLLVKSGFTSKETLDFIKLFKKEHVDPRKFNVGTNFCIYSQDKVPFSIEITLAKKERILFFNKENDNWEMEKMDIPYTSEIYVKNFKIESSLYKAFSQEHEGYNLLYNVVDIFKWTIDFFKDIRPNDSLTVLFEKIESANNKRKYGKIVCAKYNGIKVKTKYAFLFRKGKYHGYFDENGHNLKRAFLKYPLKFKRISSTYSNRRFHPVLHIYRPHHGIDYAATLGTPVHSIGDGYVRRIGWAGGAGRSITIRHTNGYESIYNHFSRYARGMRKGLHVSMGQTVGYVGMTGLATGPHLDFRIRKNGKWINPLKFKAGKGKPLKKQYMKEFKNIVAEYKKILDDPHPKLLTEKFLKDLEGRFQ